MNDMAPILKRVRKELADKPDGVLEAVASAHGLSLQRVVECLPAGMGKRIAGAHFIDVMQDIAGWGSITFIVHTKDAIVEYEGSLMPTEKRCSRFLSGVTRTVSSRPTRSSASRRSQPNLLLTESRECARS